MGYPPNFANLWDITQPPDTQAANLLGQDLRNLKNDIMQRMALLSGLLGNRPTPETVNATWGGAGFGILYFATDTGQIFQWNGAAWVEITGAISKSKIEAAGTPGTTVSNTVAVSPLGTFNLAANELLNPGQALRVNATGLIVIPFGGANPTFGWGVGGAIVDPTVTTQIAGNNIPWEFEAFYMLATSGGAAQVFGFSKFLSAVNQYSSSFRASHAPPTFSYNSTIANTMGLYVQWDVATASRSVTCNTFYVERLG